MSSDAELAIRLTADASDATAGLESVGDAAKAMASEVDAAASKADAAGSKLGGVADSADNLGSSTSQAAGGLGDLGGAMSMMPGPLGALGAGMETLAPAVQGVTGATDLATLAMNSKIVTTIRDTATTVAHTVATKTASAASKAAAAGQWLLNAALTANPIGAVVLLVVALVAGFILAYKKSETFRQIVDTAMGAAKTAIKAVVDVIKDIRDFIGDVIDKVPSMSGVFDTASTLIKGYIELWLTPLKLVKDAIEWIIDKLANLKVPDWAEGLLKTGGAGTAAAAAASPALAGTGLPPKEPTQVQVTIERAMVGDEAYLAKEIGRLLRANGVRLGTA